MAKTFFDECLAGISNPFVEDWKKKGRPILGYICAYIPRELVHSAEILPYRIGARGCVTTSQADAWMASLTCSFSRSCLELALRGEYSFLDGLVSMNTCECMRRMCDNWTHNVPTPYFHNLSVPYKSDRAAIAWYKEELQLFQQSLEASFGVSVTDDALRHSVELCNETRRLLKSFHAMRAAKDSPVTGVEAQRVTLTAYAMPAEEYNSRLAKFIEEAKSAGRNSDRRLRVMVLGNTLDDVRFTEIIEELGAVVVADASCYGAFEFWETISPGPDILESIARYYLTRLACPRMVSSTAARHNLIKDMVAMFHVDGIVFERMMYCDLWGGETMSLENELQKLNIPFLLLDREYTASGVGQLRTRLQAFIEMIRGV